MPGTAIALASDAYMAVTPSADSLQKHSRPEPHSSGSAPPQNIKLYSSRALHRGPFDGDLAAHYFDNRAFSNFAGPTLT